MRLVISQRKSLGIEQARAQLPSLVAQARQGQVSVVTKHGKLSIALSTITLAELLAGRFKQGRRPWPAATRRRSGPMS